jgi:hypothetical protein
MYTIIGGDWVRSSRIMLIVISLSIIFLCSGLVSALNSSEASVSLLWSSQTFYVGDTVNVLITFKSNYAEQLEIYYIGIHFDWMSSDGFYGCDLSSSPVTISSYGSHLFNTFSIEIPSNVTTGAHTYYVGVDGTDESTYTSFSWDSPTTTIQVSSTSAKLYNELRSQVESELNAAISANYQNAEAKSLLEQAQTQYDLAPSLANEGQWTEAWTSLQNASNYLEQASTAEQEGGGLIQGSLLFYLVIIAIVVIITVSIIVVVKRKKRKQTNPVADQPLKTIEEQS